MSSSPTFKYRGPDKRCPFPFNRDIVTEAFQPGTGYNIPLTPLGGDEGLEEACRIFWLVETMTVSMGATASVPDASATISVNYVRSGHPGPADRAGLSYGYLLPDFFTEYAYSTPYDSVGVIASFSAPRLFYHGSQWYVNVMGYLTAATNYSEWGISGFRIGTTPADYLETDPDYPGEGNKGVFSSRGNLDIFGYDVPMYNFNEGPIIFPSEGEPIFVQPTITGDSFTVTSSDYSLV